MTFQLLPALGSSRVALRAGALGFVLSIVLLGTTACEPPGGFRMGPETNPSPEARVVPSGARSRPQLCTVGDEVYLLWTDVRVDTTAPKATFLRSEDGGRSWTGETMIGEKADEPDIWQHHNPKMICDGRTIHTLWWSKLVKPIKDASVGVGDKYLRYRKSTDGGRTWGEMKTINAEPDSFNPTIALGADENVYIAWNDERVAGGHVPFFSLSSDGGETWPEEDLRLDTVGQGEGDTGERIVEAVDVELAVSGEDLVLAVWSGFPGESALPYYTASRDAGGTWSPAPPASLIPHGTQHTIQPRVVALPGTETAVVVWRGTPDYQEEHYGVHVMRTPDWGKNWPEGATEITEGLDGFNDARNLFITNDEDGTIFLAWDDKRLQLKWDVWLSRSLDGGKTWVPPQRMDIGTEIGTVTAETPFLATGSEGKVLLLWMDRRRDGFSSVYARLSQDDGETWGEEVYVGGGTSRETVATFPAAVFLESGGAVVVWQEGLKGAQLLKSRVLRID